MNWAFMDIIRRFFFIAFIASIPFVGTLAFRLNSSLRMHLIVDFVYGVVLIITLVECWQTRRAFIVPRSLKIPIGIALLAAFITFIGANIPQALNAEAEQPLLIWLWGLKVLLGYLFIVPCTYYWLRDRRDLTLLLRLQVAIASICCILGIAQYALLSMGVCGVDEPNGALFQASLPSACLVGGSFLYNPTANLIRLPGTFASPFQWDWFLISSVFFCFATVLNERDRYWQWAAGFSIVVAWINAEISGARFAPWLIPFSVIILLLSTGQMTNWRRLLFFGAGLAVFIALFSDRYINIVSSWQASPPIEFLSQQFSWVLRRANVWFGQGLGRATNSARFFGTTRLIETYPSKLLYEVGIPGLAAILALYTTLVVNGFQAYRRVNSSQLRQCALTLWLFIVLFSYCPYHYPLDVAPVNVYYWLAAGIVLRLPEL